MAIEKSKNTYLWPIPPDVKIERIVEENNLSHIGIFSGAIDIVVPVGTPVLAVGGGKVIATKDDSSEYGTDKSFADKANYITLQHDNGEYSEYVHLDNASATVKAGQEVKAGDVIAKVGLSGWTTAPHLHFHVFRLDTHTEFRCLYPKITNVPSNYNQFIDGVMYGA